MKHFSAATALGLMRRTAPFVLFRMAVYFGIAVALVLVTGTGAGVGYGIGGFGDAEFRASATLYGGLFGFAGTAGVIFFFRDYLLYIVKAGHIAVMVELLRGGTIPDGRGQIDWATDAVKARFGQASALFALDRLIVGVLTAITGLVQGMLLLLPIPGLDRVMGVVRAYLRLAVGLVDEVMLAHTMDLKSDNPYAASREALVLYAQNAKPMMINAAWLTAIVWGLSLVVFLVMLAPAAAVVYLMPGAWSAGGVVFALVFAWAAKAALIEPFAIACMLQAFFRITDGQVANPEWEAKLDAASAKFKTLGEKAVSWVGGFGGRRGTPTAAGAVSPAE